MINSIDNVLANSEKAIAVFTTHDQWSSNFILNDDGSGRTGDWVLRKNPNVNTVVIYHRKGSSNHIYKAKISEIEGPLDNYEKSHRYIIHFHNCERLGLTHENWSDFADCGSNPVRYFNT